MTRRGTADLDRVLGALADPTRRGILLALLDDDEARTVDEVAQRAGIHRTVAFGHLERLLDLGYLTKSKRRGRLGKPAALYAPSGVALAVQFPIRQFATLGVLLAEALGGVGEGVAAAHAAGRRFGQGMAARPARSVEEALLPLHALGGDHEVCGDEIRAGNCVFFEACSAHPEVICELHAGVLEGALDGAGIPASVKPCGVVGPAACAFQVLRGGAGAREQHGVGVPEPAA